MSHHRHPNRLIRETSPYLLQHAHNPVDWYPWGPEALERARREDKPILLSIGYSACHWCHVMERESFENEDIARLMNESFIPVKVDREERPDLDQIYMQAVQLMSGSGGWPLTVFLTPDTRPFFGGTYFPPVDTFGRPGFKTVLLEISRIYREERHRVSASTEQLIGQMRDIGRIPRSRDLLSTDLIAEAVRELERRFDPNEGGFSPPPKFPPSGALSLLLRHHRSHRDPGALHMVEMTLDKMAGGGMYDQIGGGFHRYSTDERWLVPHFEKMLYDNALLARVYLEAFQVTGKQGYARVARETLEYVLREMQDPQGGYYSSQDADSEGKEGRFYVWSREEIHALLGEAAEAFCRFYDVTPSGNWERKNILNRPRSVEALAAELGMTPEELDALLSSSRRVLLLSRDQRVKPALDDKVLTSWNGLTIIAMARGHRVLGEERFLHSARSAARFLLDHVFSNRRLLATYRDGRANLPAYLDDYAFLLGGFVELYESDFDVRWLDEATHLATDLARLFHDVNGGGFFFTGSDHEQLLIRSKSGYDGATPSGNAVAAAYLLKLSTYTGDPRHASLAQETIRAFHAQMQRSPSAFAEMLCAVDYYLGARQEIAVVGPESSPETSKALAGIWRCYTPSAAIAFLDPSWPHRDTVEEKVPLLKGKTSGTRAPRFYVCENYACQAPTERLEEVLSALCGG